MKLTYFQLEQHLIKTLHHTYILSGDDLFLKQEASKFIRQAAKANGFSERIVFDTTDWEALYPLLNAGSLLAEKRIIEIDISDSQPSKTGQSIIKEYLDNPTPDCLLIIATGKVDAKLNKNSWFQAVVGKSAHVTIWPVSQEQLPQWIMQRAKRYRLALHFQTAVVLADYVEGNLIAAAQAIEKLYLLQPPLIDAELIHDLIKDEGQFSVFDFTASFLALDRKRMLHILEMLKAEGVEPILILWAITRELRLIAEIAENIQSGMTFEFAFQKHRIYAKRQQLMRECVHRYQASDIRQLLTFAGEIDKVAKGAMTGNPWDLLQLFCLRV